MSSGLRGQSSGRTGTRASGRYLLIAGDRKPYVSENPGTLGGHRRNKIYGRLDCRTALMWIEKGHYVKHRVFFAKAADAVSAGYRPCANCLPEQYAEWKVERP